MEAITAAAPIFSAVSAVGSLLGGAGALLSTTKKPPPPAPLPEIKEPPVMPTPDDRAAMEARRKQIAIIQQRSGRESTFLSDEGRSDRLGAG